MKTILACLILIFCSLSAHAVFDIVDLTWVVPPQNVFGMSCKYEFGWGRNAVTVDYDGVRSECSFSHTERAQVPPNASGIRYTVYTHNYTCLDGARAKYSTDWLGGSYGFYFSEGGAEIRCP